MNNSSSKRMSLSYVIAVGVLTGLLSTARAEEAVRPEVGKPLQAAQELIKAHKFKEALAKVRDADAVPHKTAAEGLLIERMRIAAASGAGDPETIVKSYEALNASGKLSAPEKLRMLESLTTAYYRIKDYPKTVVWGKRYLADGGTSAQIRTLLIQSQYLAGDYAGAIKELALEIQAEERAGRKPSEERLALLINAAQRVNDSASYVMAMEKQVAYYPKKEYWSDLLSRVQQKPTFSDRLALDTYRLMLASGSMKNANDYMEMAQLSLQAGLPAEGKMVVEKGFAAGVLGVGPVAEADRHKRLRDMVVKRTSDELQGLADRQAQAAAAKTGTDLVNVGFSQVFQGHADKGIELMSQGMSKGGLKRPEDAKLRLGVAWWLAGQNDKALSVFKTVAGADGTADLARLWSLLAKNKV